MCSTASPRRNQFGNRGTASGYHPVTYGFLVGEIARLADRQKPNPWHDITRRILRCPKDIDFFIGTPRGQSTKGVLTLHKPKLPCLTLGDINPGDKSCFPHAVVIPGWARYRLLGASSNLQVPMATARPNPRSPPDATGSGWPYW